MSQNNPSDESPGLGHFLTHRHWRDALCLLRYQLKRKEKNSHFRTVEMFYYEKLKESLKGLEDEKYFKARVANNLFYGLTDEFAVIPYTIPKSNLGLRRYKFMTCPIRILYYAIGIYLFRLSRAYLKGYECHQRLSSYYGAELIVRKGRLKLEPKSVYFASHYKDFCEEVKKESEKNTERKVVIRLDIENYFDEISIPKLLDFLKKRLKPSIKREMNYDEATRSQLISFFDFLAGGTSGIPQSDNNVVSSFIGHLFLVFGDLYLDDKLLKHKNLFESHKIIRYMDDIYISITFKKQAINLRSNFNSLVPGIADCLHQKLQLRLNPKTTIFQLKEKDDREALIANLKMVSLEDEDGENDTPPDRKIDEILNQLRKLKKSPSAPHFQEHTKSKFNQEKFKYVLKGVYDENVVDILEDSDNPSYRVRLRRIFLRLDGFDFELVNLAPKTIIILMLTCNEVKEAFEEFLLSKSNLTSRDTFLVLMYLCQVKFSRPKLLCLLKQDRQMREIMEIFESPGLSSELPGYHRLTAEQTFRIARPHIIDQIRLRRLAEQQGEYSVALNHLLNEIHAICRLLDCKKTASYTAREVGKFLRRENLPHETQDQIRNLFDRRNKSTVSHADPIAWPVSKEEYEGYRDNVGQCLKHLRHLLQNLHDAR